MKTNYSNVSMLDMVFEHRNKAYGAYQLRSSYNQSLAKAMLITASGVITLLAALFISQHIKAEKPMTTLQKPVDDTLQVVEYIAHKKEEPKPIQRHNREVHKPVIDNREMRVVAHLEHDKDSVLTTDERAQFDPGIVTDLTGEPEIITEPEVFMVTKKDPPVYDYTEFMPEFPGGEKKLREFLIANTRYPEMERENGISGKASIQFIINEDGSVSDIAVLKSDSRNFSKEASKVVGMLPRFTPGRMGGKNVKVRMVLPFKWESKD